MSTTLIAVTTAALSVALIVAESADLAMGDVLAAVCIAVVPSDLSVAAFFCSG